MSGGQNKLVIGLAGGIGAGKSTVAGMFAELGARVIDSDRLNHEELCAPEVIDTLVQWYGERVRDPQGRIRPSALAEIVFNDPQQRARVEGLLHPRIEERRRQLIERWGCDPQVRAIVLDSPLLYEAGLDKLCDVVVFVDAPSDDREKRVAQSRGWPADELARREKSQKPLDSKRALADHILVSCCGLDDLRIKVEELLSELLVHTSE